MQNNWKTSSLRLTTLLLVFVGSILANGADEVARVRTKLATEPPMWVGQEVSFHVELMSSTFFSGAPHFDLPDIPGAFVMKVEGRPVLGTEQVDGESWSIQRHGFRIYAHRPGKFTMPSFLVKFSVAPAFGKPPEEQRLKTDSIEFEAKLPPGAEGLSLLIATPQLDVEEVWNPTILQDDQLQLEVGDAITRQISLAAKDVPGMALPAIPIPEAEGVSAYPKQPTVTDQVNRGDLTGRRTDSVTFICERPGRVILPSIVIPWWDTDAKQVQRVTLPSVTIEVIQETTKETEPEETAIAAQSPWYEDYSLIFGILSVFLLTTAVWYLRAPISARLKNWKARFTQSEPAFFFDLLRACMSNDPRAALNALMRWIDKQSSSASEVVTIDAFLNQHGSSKLTEELIALQHAALHPSSGWVGRRLLRQLIELRIKPRGFARVYARLQLPTLNPREGKS